jgi:hypothetical protein
VTRESNHGKDGKHRKEEAAWVTFTEPEASAPGVARESNHGKDGKHRKEEAAWVTFTEPEA